MILALKILYTSVMNPLACFRAGTNTSWHFTVWIHIYGGKLHCPLLFGDGERSTTDDCATSTRSLAEPLHFEPVAFSAAGVMYVLVCEEEAEISTESAVFLFFLCCFASSERATRNRTEHRQIVQGTGFGLGHGRLVFSFT